MNYLGDAFNCDSYSNIIPDEMTSNSLALQISEKDLINNVARTVIEPVPLHPKPFDCCPKLEDDFEPTPIHPKGISYSFPTKLQCLPEMITKYCDDYISLLLGDLDEKTLCPDEINQGACVSSDESTGTASYPAFQNERWMDRFHELVNFYKKEGHYSVPYKRNTTLFQWVKRQRHQYKLRNMGEHSNLTQERIDVLTKIGFVWNSHMAAWNDKFKELEEFKVLHGHCFVPCNYKGSAQLSTWIKRQRRQYRKFMASQPSTLDAERIDKLDMLGLVWDYYGGKEVEPCPQTKSKYMMA
jgi:hypothetical protein